VSISEIQEECDGVAGQRKIFAPNCQNQHGESTHVINSDETFVIMQGIIDVPRIDEVHFVKRTAFSDAHRMDFMMKIRPEGLNRAGCVE
jgi:hypothetical protein